MEDRKIKSIRRSQTLSPFGVGAIMDIEGESLVAADITYWRGAGEDIHEPRLEKFLSVRKFVMAQPEPEYKNQITPATRGVPFARFPSWMFCSNCRHMYQRFSREEVPTCPNCKRNIQLTPMRFVMACPRGHLADVPWEFWAHSNSKSGRCEKPELVFKTEAGGSGLEFVYVECLTCKSKRNLYGMASKDSMAQLGVRCPGHHPWTPWAERETDCDAIPQVLQRGATNLTFSAIVSSIDIPPHSSWSTFNQDIITITNDPMFSVIRGAFKNGQTKVIEMGLEHIANNTGIRLDVVRRIINRELGEDEVEREPTDAEDLLAQEYEALSDPSAEYDSRDRFIKNDVNLDEYPEAGKNSAYHDAVASLKECLGGLSQVTRLREVRVLRGFSRLGPSVMEVAGDDEPAGRFSLYGSDKKIVPLLVPADLNRLNRTESWLPAVEVYGEGIFIRLNEKNLQSWEQIPAVNQRASKLADRRNLNAPYLPQPTPRLILLHTLAHVLIRQLSFECGYSIASLRERIYSVSPEDGRLPAAGILIYTAAGDAEGTLGGLVREGRVERLLPTMLKAIQSAEWCSSDPLCRESQGQGLYAMNLAACHACSLLPETSCTMSNRLLDRIMLLGSIDGSVPGFFSEVIGKITSSRIS